MMPKNLYKLISAIFLIQLTGCNDSMNNKSQFYWYSTESAPKYYPMEIIRGDFIYKGEKEKGLYIPTGGTLKAGWGTSISSHVTGQKFKPLPDRLNIIFFSYAEKQFYKGEFQLPYEKILSLFQQGIEEDANNPLYSGIMVGVAPGGSVAVWVIGREEYKEVFFGKAEKISLNYSSAFKLPFKDDEDANNYMHEGLVEAVSSEQYEKLKKEGVPFGLWERYRNLYNWIPIKKNGSQFSYLSALLLNGESKKNWINFNIKEKNIVPTRISFKTEINNKKVLYIINFEEFETMEAFEKLGAKGEAVYIEFDPKWPRTNTTVRIYNKKESIELTKIEIEDW